MSRVGVQVLVGVLVVVLVGVGVGSAQSVSEDSELCVTGDGQSVVCDESELEFVVDNVDRDDDVLRIEYMIRDDGERVDFEVYSPVMTDSGDGVLTGPVGAFSVKRVPVFVTSGDSVVSTVVEVSVPSNTSSGGQDSSGDDNEFRDEDSPRSSIFSSGSITTDGASYVPDESFSGPYRVNDESFTGSYESVLIPPGLNAVGTVSSFENLRGQQSENTQDPAVLSSTDGELRIGMSYVGVAQGVDVEDEIVELRTRHALQSTSGERVRMIVTDKYGNELDPSTERYLESTVSESYDTAPLESARAVDLVDIKESSGTEMVLTETEKAYISNTDTVYIQYELDTDGVLFLYQSNLNVCPRADASCVRGVDTPDVYTSNPDNFNPATFNAEYTVNGDLNEQYGTYDVEPTEELSIDVTVSNTGDARVKRTLEITDTFEETGNTDIISTKTVTVDPRSSRSFTIDHSWPAAEFGNHTLEICDVSGKDILDGPTDGRNECYGPSPSEVVSTSNIPDSTSTQELLTTRPSDTDHSLLQTAESDAEPINVYVLQEATFEITDILYPNSWLVYDNFNVTVKAKNVGDLTGSATLVGQFQDWTDSKIIPTTQGGDVRGNVDGNNVTIRFTRDAYDYSPSYPTRPNPGPVNYDDRPVSPYGIETGNSQFTAITSHNFARPIESQYESIRDIRNTDPIEMYKLQIEGIKIENKYDDDYTWYASGYPYYSSSDSSFWTAGYDVSTDDIEADPTGAMPTYENTDHVYPPLNYNPQPQEPNRRMTATVTVSNNGSATTGLARVRILSDRINGGFDDKTVGTGGVIVPSRDTVDITVPVIIPNNQGNNGTHNLTAVVRTDPDYIEPTTITSDAVSITSTDARSITTEIELWEDFLAQDLDISSTTLNEQCDGYTPATPDGSTPSCNPDEEERLTVNTYYKNVGGISGELTPDVYIDTDSDPSGTCENAGNQGGCTGNSQYTPLEYISEITTDADGTTNYWNNQSQTIDPTNTNTFTATNIPFDEPGIYRLKATPHRSNNQEYTPYFGFGSTQSRLPEYEVLDFTPRNQHELIKILDITHPDSYLDISDDTFDCKSGTCTNTEHTDSFTIWEGGTVELTGKDSTDNVRITRHDWDIQNDEFNGGFTQCDGDYCYSTGGYSKNNPARDIYHRFDTPGTYNVSLTTTDDPAYGVGATLNSDGDPNTNTTTQQITVQDDTTPPTVSLDEISRSNPDNSPSGTSVLWHAEPTTNYYGIESCVTATQSDNAIGIESDAWNGISGSYNQDTRCRTWTTPGDKTLRYSAWDFAGNDNDDTFIAPVKHDSTTPTATCPGGCDNSESDLGNYDSDTTGSYAYAYASGSATEQSCVVFEEQGTNGGVGLDTTSITTTGDAQITTATTEKVEVCVTASAFASTSAQASANAYCSVSCSGCGDSDRCRDTDRDSDGPNTDYDEELSTGTATVTDYHGNTAQTTRISAYAEADASAYAEAYDSYRDSCSTGPCPEE